MIRRTFLSSLLAPILARFAPEAKAEAPKLNTTGWAEAYIENGHLFYDLGPTWRDMGLVPAGDPNASMRFHPPIVPSGGLDVRFVRGQDVQVFHNGVLVPIPQAERK